MQENPLGLLKKKFDPEQEEIAREKIVQSFFIEKFNTNEITKGWAPKEDYSTGISANDSWTKFFQNIPYEFREEPEILDRLKILSEDRLFVDLGCGSNQDIAIDIANVVGSKAYLGVDKFNVGGTLRVKGDGGEEIFHRKTKDITAQIKIQDSIPAILWQEDMVEALKKIKNDSAILMFNGMEPELFDMMSPEKHKKYFTELANEVKRVVGKNGYILSSNPIVFSSFLKLKENKEYKKAFLSTSNFGFVPKLIMYQIID